MPSTLPWHAAIGFSSVGDGVSSIGEFNTSSGSCAAIIENALANGSGIVLLKGIYDLDRYVNVVGEGKQIIVSAGVEIRNAASGTVGCFQFNSPRQVLAFTGGKIIVDTWVNSQKVINVAVGADYCTINDFYADVTTTGGNTSTPMDILASANTIDLQVSGFTLHPNIGVRGMNITRASGARLERVSIRTNSVNLGVSQRACWEAIRITGGRGVTLDGVRIQGLGTLTTGEMNAVITVNGDPNLTSLEGDYIDLQMSNVSIVSCASPRGLELRGVIGFQGNGLHFENFLGAIAAAGETALFIDSEDGTSTVSDESKICGVGNLTNLKFESVALAQGTAIYVKNGKKIDFNDVHTHMPSAGPDVHILLNTDQGRSIHFKKLRIDGNSKSTGIGTLYGVKFEAAAVATPIDIHFADVRGSGCLYGPLPGREPSSWYGAGYTLDDGSPILSHNLSSGALGASSGRQIIDDSALGVSLGGVVTVVPTVSVAPATGGVASGTPNYSLAVICQKINRLWCGFGQWNSNLTDPGTGVATDGIVAAITNAQTMDDACRELIVKTNEIINLGKSSAGRSSFLATWLNGPATSAAVKAAAGALTYSAGTISAAAADNSINDAANAFPAFAAGDIVSISGFTGVATTANTLAYVVSRTVSKIVLQTATPLVNDAAGETVTITRVSTNPLVASAVAKLVDSTGGTSDPTFSGIIGATISSNATANNAVATAITQLNGLLSYFCLQTNSAIMSLDGL